MSLSGNRGEWSEVYALFKLLSDQELYLGDENLNIIKKSSFPIEKVLRTENYEEISFTILGDHIRIEYQDDTINLSKETFQEKAEFLLSQIKNKENKGSFSCFEIENFLSIIYCTSIKEQSSSTADLSVIIRDVKNTEYPYPRLEYNVKSKLGSLSTLFNANKDATNFIYEITKLSLKDSDMEEINQIKTKNKIIDRISEIQRRGGELVFYKTASQTLKNNLIYIDSRLPEIIGRLIYYYYVNNLNQVSEITEKISKDNPLNFEQEDVYKFYEEKIKNFLLQASFGMTPQTAWTGNFGIERGILVVTRKGNLVSYHIYTKNNYKDYLFKYTKLDKPSSSRHKYGSIYKEGGKYFIKLNLQVRFR